MMKLVCLCFSLVFGYFGPALPSDQIDKIEHSSLQEEVLLSVNQAELKEQYSEELQIELRVPEMFYQEDLKFVAVNADKELLEVCNQEWKKEEDEWIIHWVFQEDVKDAAFALMTEAEIVYSSNRFSVDTQFKKPLFTLNGERFDGQTFVGKDALVLRWKFEEPVDIEKSSVLIEKDKIELEWDATHTIATYQLQEEVSYPLTYQFYDLFGNKIEDQMIITIDHTSPKVETWMNEKNTNSGIAKFYQKTANLLIRVEERSLDTLHSFLSVNGTKKELQWKRQGDAYQSEYAFDEGSYDVVYYVQDDAGNVLTGDLPHFTMDSTAPKILVDMEQTLQNHEQLINFKVVDQGFDEERCLLHVVHNGVSSFRKAEVRKDGNEQIGSVRWEDEGAYEFYIEAYDFAGNRSVTKTYAFVIDKTPPQSAIYINQLKVKNNATYMTNKDIEIKYELEDVSNFYVSLYKNDRLVGTSTALEVMKLEAQYNSNDDYAVVLYARDQAGNESVCRVQISIYTKKTPIRIENDVFENKKPYNNSWTPQISNKETYHVITSQLYKNHLPVDYQWGDAIDKDGEYALHVVAMDDARNLSTMKDTFYFSIDKTAPILSMTSDKGNIEKSVDLHQPITIRILNEKDKKGKEQFSYIKINQRIIKGITGSTYQFTPEKAGNYVVECSAYDEAGNTTVKTWQFQVKKSPKAVKQASFFRKTQYGTATLIGGLFLVTIGFILLKRHVRRRT